MNEQNRLEFREFHTGRSDVDGARRWMTQINGPHWLQAQTPQMVEFSHSACVMRSMSTTLGCLSYGTDVTIGIERTQHMKGYSASLPLAGFQVLRKGGQRYVSDTDHGLVLSPDEDQELMMSGDCRKLLISITRAAMRSCLDELLQSPSVEPLRFEPLMDAGDDTVASWWRSVRYLLEEIARCQELYSHVAYARDIETALVKGLILAQPNNYSQQLREASAARMPHYLIKARDFIRQQAATDLCLEDIEQAAGISRAKLFEGFKRYFDTTPMACLKRTRLEMARRALLEEPSNRNVSIVALNCGFKHLSRFSSEYRKLFGECPSVTARRNRIATP